MRSIYLTLFVLVAACSDDREPPAAPRSELSADESRAPAATASASATASGPQASLARERMLIREASVRLRAADPAALAAKAGRVVAAAGGFVLDSALGGSDGEPRELELQLRVPEARLDATLAGLCALGSVLEETVTGRDVTEEFVDLEARLAAQRTLEARLLALAQSSAALKDLLAVEQELARVRGEIESRQGRMRYLSERTRMASIRLLATAPEQPVVAAAESLGSRLGNALSRAREVALVITELAIVTAGGALPLLLLGGLVLVPLRLLRRRTARA